MQTAAYWSARARARAWLAGDALWILAPEARGPFPGLRRLVLARRLPRRLRRARAAAARARARVARPDDVARRRDRRGRRRLAHRRRLARTRRGRARLPARRRAAAVPGRRRDRAARPPRGPHVRARRRRPGAVRGRRRRAAARGHRGARAAGRARAWPAPPRCPPRRAAAPRPSAAPTSACPPRSRSPRSACCVWDRQVGALSPSAIDLALAVPFLLVLRLAVSLRENTRLLERSRDEALTDALTGLGNRRALMRALSDALEEAVAGRPWRLALFDLDGFKAYNDVFGHVAGDVLIEHLGGRLAGSVKGVGRAFRMGGDEFCVLVPAERATAALVRAGEALREEGEGFRIDASVGVVELPGDVADAEAALQLADRRMYAQKEGRPHSPARQSGDVLLRVIGEREPELLAHTRAVAELSRALASAMGLDAETARDGRPRRRAARRRQGRRARRDPLQARPARRGRGGVHAPPHRDRRVDHRRGARAARGRRARAREPRALGRHGLPRQPGRPRDPARRADRLRLRRLQRDAPASARTARCSARRRRSTSCAAAPAASSTRRSSRRSASCAAPAAAAGASSAPRAWQRQAEPARARRPVARPKPPDRSRPPRRRPRSPRSARRSGAGSSHIGVWPSPRSTRSARPGSRGGSARRGGPSAAAGPCRPRRPASAPAPVEVDDAARAVAHRLEDVLDDGAADRRARQQHGLLGGDEVPAGHDVAHPDPAEAGPGEQLLVVLDGRARGASACA